MSISPYSEKLADFAYKLDFEELPGGTVERAKLCVLDIIGVSLAGYHSKSAQLVIELVKDLGSKGQATIIAHSEKVSCPQAALVNAVMGSTMEFDDTSEFGWCHPATIVIPAAMAIAEQEKATGKDLLISVVLGYEVGVRLGGVVVPSIQDDRGMQANNTNTFGAAVAAGKILELNRRGFANALGICSVTPLLSFEAFIKGSQTKDLHAGFPAMTGVLAAMLAKKGFTGPSTIIEGEYGFAKNVADSFNLQKLTDRLGERYWSLDPKYHCFKRFPCCTITHPVILSTLGIMNRYKLSPEEVREVLVRGYKSMLIRGSESKPETYIGAKISIPYIVAAAILGGKVDTETFSDKMLKNPKLLTLAEKVKIVVDPEYERRRRLLDTVAAVEIVSKNGNRYSQETARSEVPCMTAKEVYEKFRRLADKALSNNGIDKTDRTKKINKIISKVERLEKLATIDELTKLLRF